jgi:hypothetical protein
VAVRCRLETGKPFAEVRTYGTMTRDLRAMADYLQALGVTHVALESTGVLWKPVWNIRDGRFTLLLVNPRHVKQVPDRKSDVSGAEWIAQLLQLALEGHFSDHHPFLVEHLDELERHVEEISRRIAEQLHPLLDGARLARLDAIPGVNRTTIENVVAEIGVDMSVFPDEHHLSSWAGICPGNEESAGKRLRSRTTRKNRWLLRALVEAAWAAGRASAPRPLDPTASARQSGGSLFPCCYCRQIPEGSRGPESRQNGLSRGAVRPRSRPFMRIRQSIRGRKRDERAGVGERPGRGQEAVPQPIPEPRSRDW